MKLKTSKKEENISRSENCQGKDASSSDLRFFGSRKDINRGGRKVLADIWNGNLRRAVEELAEKLD